jgi:L-arabinonolactonase
MAVEIRRFGSVLCKLGECPVWDPESATLFLVDIEDSLVMRLDTDGRTLGVWSVPADTVGCLALHEAGRLVLAAGHRFFTLDLETGATAALGDPVSDNPRVRFNDGRTDRQGRFFAGTMDIEATEPLGVLYRLDSDLSWRPVESGLTIANGSCCSPDGSIFYLADSVLHRIWAYDLAPESGEIGNRRVLVDTSQYGVTPDGCTVDEEGYLWSACVGSGMLARYDASGSLDRTIELPTPFVSSVSFGGIELETLFVTSIGQRHFGVPETDPLAGAIFAINGLGVTGVAEAPFSN